MLQHQLGAGVGAAPDRSVGAPEVLADLEGDRAEVETEDQIAEGHAADVRDVPGTPRETVRPS